MIEGRLGASLNGQQVEAGPGTRLTVLPGTPHRLWNAGEQDLHLVCEVRPAVDFAERLDPATASAAAVVVTTNQRGTVVNSRNRIVRRWIRRLSLAGSFAALAVGAAPAAAEPQYNNGTHVSLYGTSPVSGLRHAATSWFAGYIGDTADPSFPRVGDVFYIRGIVANTSASLTDAPIMSFVFDPQFEPDVEYAVSAANPVQCLYYPDINLDGQPDPDYCRQTPDVGFTPRGSFFGGGRLLQPGEGFEVRVPVRVRAPKNGLASGGAARFGVHVLSSHGAGLAVQSVVVAPGAAAPTPAPVTPPAPAAEPAGGTGNPPAQAAAPRVSRVLVAISPRATSSSLRVARLRLRLSEPARVTVRVQRRANAGAPYRAVGASRSLRLAAGSRTIALGRLAAGSYRVLVRVRDAGGSQSAAQTAFVVKG